jgi:soluble lytic murein transglycosylase-like protein
MKIRVIILLLLLCIPTLVFANDVGHGAMDGTTQRYYQIIYNAALYYSGLTPEWANWISLTIISYSYKYSINPLFATTMLIIESGLNHWEYQDGVQVVKESPSGALGFAQLMPGTAAALGVDPLDPEQNIEGGIKYLRQQLDRFQYAGVWGTDYAIAAYNCGPGKIKEYGGIPPYPETINYLHKFAQIYNQLDGEFQRM